MKYYLIFFCFALNLSSQAQSDSAEKPLIQLRQSLKQQNYSLLSPYLSDNYQLGNYSRQVADQIIPQIYSQYPRLLSMSWEKENDTLFSCAYAFEHGGSAQSVVLLDKTGKIVRIELFDDILAQSDQRIEDGQNETSFKSIPFMSQEHLEDFYRQMILEIESLDAEGIATRNLKKDVTWQQYVTSQKSSFLKASSWSELAEAFENFGRGFVNLHSRFQWEMPVEKNTELLSGSPEIGYTYPEISFFEVQSKQIITHLNQHKIKDVFQHFNNYQCAYNSDLGCLDHFCRRLNKAFIYEGDTIQSLTFDNGEVREMNPYADTGSIHKDPYARYKASVDTTRYPDWQLVAAGYKVALFQKGDVALIRIKDFLYFSGNGGGVRCEDPAPDSTMCGDIQILRAHLKQMPGVQHLIFDVQNNGGGNENSSFIAEFSQGPFYDLAVQFRKTIMLEEGQLRNTLFYGSPMSQQWYDKIRRDSIYDKIEYGDFLPLRADFCAGDTVCDLKAIQPNHPKPRFKSIYILTNHNCVSSCDDFVWRMSQFSQAKVIGLEQAADATYSRIGIVFYLDGEGQLKTSYEGGGRQFPVQGTRLAKMTIPYSRTMTTEGKIRQGVPAKLDLMVPVTKENFGHHEKSVLDTLYEKIASGESFD